MDLSFTLFDRAAEPRTRPVDLAALMVVAAARQAASATARAQVELARAAFPADPTPFAPPDGRFSAPTARALAEWKGG